MGRLIDFKEKSDKKQKDELQSIDFVFFLPKLSLLKGEIIVIYIHKSVIKNEKLLTNLLKEVIALKCMEATTIVVPDINEQIINYCNENFGTSNPFLTSNSIDLCGQGDIFDVVAKNETVNNILGILKKFNAKTLAVSGNTIDILFPDEVVNQNISAFIKQNREIYTVYSGMQRKKYSLDLLNELLKTNIILFFFKR